MLYLNMLWVLAISSRTQYLLCTLIISHRKIGTVTLLLLIQFWSCYNIFHCQLLGNLEAVIVCVMQSNYVCTNTRAVVQGEKVLDTLTYCMLGEGRSSCQISILTSYIDHNNIIQTISSCQDVPGVKSRHQTS